MIVSGLKAGDEFTHRSYDGKLIATGAVDKDGDYVILERDENGFHRMSYMCPDEPIALVKEEPEPTYAERQAAWVAEHGIEVGSKVKVTRKAESGEAGWQAGWNLSMDSFVGKCIAVKSVGASVFAGGWTFPYFVLESVAEQPAIDVGPGWRELEPDELPQEGDELRHKDSQGPDDWLPSSNWKMGRPQAPNCNYRRRIAPVYRPFTAEEAAKQIGKVVMSKADPNYVAVLIAARPKIESIAIGANSFSYAHVLDSFTFLDGSPCGVPE